MSNDGHFSFTGNFHAAAPLDSSFINDNDDNPNGANTNTNTSTSIGINNNNSTTISNNINTNIINVDSKVVIWFRPVGNAPILKQTKFKISSNHRFQTIIDFLKKQLHLDSKSDSLYLYINSSFSPGIEETIINLYKCFQIDGQLIVNYSVIPAWG